jgi:hypothetical protein
MTADLCVPDIDAPEYVSAERFIAFCDEAYWTSDRAENPARLRVRDGSLIFTHTDHVFELFRVLRRHPARVVLVTSESDHAVSERHFASRPWNVVEWFGVNAVADDPRCHVLPLGLANSSCRVTLKPSEIAGLPGSGERPGWLYVNHRVETNPQARQPVYDFFARHAREGWVTLREASPRGEKGTFREDMLGHRFVCCPPGNGIDTHRMWEALYCGTIPIVLRSRVTEAFAGLPIVLVKDYSEVSLPFLQDTFEKMRAMEFDFRPLYSSYWEREFRAAQARTRRTPFSRLMTGWVGRKFCDLTNRNAH